METDPLRGLRRQYPQRRLFERHVLLEVNFSTERNDQDWLYGWDLGDLSFVVRTIGRRSEEASMGVFLWARCNVRPIQGDRMLSIPVAFRMEEIGTSSDWSVRVVRPTRRFQAHLFVDVTTESGLCTRRSSQFYPWSFDYFIDAIVDVFGDDGLEPREGPDFCPPYVDGASVGWRGR